MTENPSTTLHGTVKRSSRLACPANLKKRRYPSTEPTTFTRKLRIENTLTDEGGNEGPFEARSHCGDHSRGRAAGGVHEK
jgi:hypothetical protein